MNYSKFKKAEQSVLLYGNDSRSSSNYSFVMPSNNGFNDVSKLHQPKANVQVIAKKDFSKIVMEGKGLNNSQVRVKNNRRKGQSQPKCQ